MMWPSFIGKSVFSYDLLHTYIWKLPQWQVQKKTVVMEYRETVYDSNTTVVFTAMKYLLRKRIF